MSEPIQPARRPGAVALAFCTVLACVGCAPPVAGSAGQPGRALEAPAAPAEIVGTEEAAMRAALIADGRYAAPIELPESVRVRGVEVPFEAVRDYHVERHRLAMQTGRENRARLDALDPEFAARHGGVTAPEAEREWAAQVGAVLKRRFGFRDYTFYSNRYEAPVVFHGRVPDPDGSSVTLAWTQGEITLGARASGPAQRIGRLLGCAAQPRQIDSAAIRAAFGSLAFFEACGAPERVPVWVRAAAGYLVSAAPAPPGYLGGLGTVQVAHGPAHLGAGLRRVGVDVRPEVAAAALGTLLLRGARAPEPANVACAPAAPPNACITTLDTGFGREHEIRVRFDRDGSLAGLELTSVEPAKAGQQPIDAQPYTPMEGCEPTAQAAAPPTQRPGPARVVASEAEFHSVLGCEEPSGIDWQQHRLVLVEGTVMGASMLALDRAYAAGGKVHVVIAPFVTFCQGIAPMPGEARAAALVPAGPEPVVVEQGRGAGDPCPPVP